jgi:oxygen-independent coproporphyrinogen-3 oxidase
MSALIPLSLYIHVPWCIKKCPYCDFNSHAVKSELPEQAYIRVLLDDLARDIEYFNIDRPISTVFIGGGTPSLFSPESFECLLTGIKTRANLIDGAEITLEANPGTFESIKFAEFNALGINRLSIGVQSFNESALQKLGRVHSGNEAIRAVEIAHNAGFDNINLDFMFGIPGNTPADSLNDINTAIALKPTHISFYQLTLEPNTLFHKYPPRLPDDDTIYGIQLNCQQQLANAGYGQYEISAYSQPNRECRHNLNYWQFGDYLGIGAGAHGKISLALPNRIIRTFKPKKPEDYLQNWALNTQHQSVVSQDLPLEYLMNQLRLKQGFSLADYLSRTGLEETTLHPGLANCMEQNLIEDSNGFYRCTNQGWNFLDSVLTNF